MSPCLRLQRLKNLGLGLVVALAAAIQAAEPAGSATLSITGSREAGAVSGLEILFSNNRELLPGTTIMLCPHWQQTAGLQVEDPAAAGYLTIAAAEPEVVFAAGYLERQGVYGGLESYRLCPEFTLTAGVIQAGSSITLQSAALRLPTRPLTEYRLALYLRDQPGSEFEPVTANAVTLDAGPRAGLSIMADPLTAPGEAVNILVRQEDAYGNLASPSELTLDLLINGVFFRRVPASQAVTAIPDVRFEVPGTYVVELRSGGGGIRAASDPIVVSQSGNRILWVDLGETSYLSDGRESVEELVTDADGRYDIRLLADHSADGLAQHWFERVSSQGLWRPLEQGGAIQRLVHEDGRTIEIGMPEQPTDLRRFAPESLRLVQVVTAGARHLWLADKLLAAGYDVGFVGTNHSHQYPHDRQPVSTGLVIMPGQDWFEALAEGQTYVTTGRRMTIQTRFDAMTPDKARDLSIQVDAPVPVSAIRLYRNGRLLVTQDQGEASDAEMVLTLGVESDNRPRGRHFSRPRNAREWVGYVSTLDTPVQAEAGRGWQISQGRDPNRIDFLVRTQGTQAAARLLLPGAAEEVILEIVLAEGFEDAAWLPADRLPQPIPAQRFLVSLAEIEGGATRQMNIGGYQDRLVLARSGSISQKSASFSYRDEDPASLGDYYYFEVVLEDGSTALTSPRLVQQEAGDSDALRHLVPEVAESL